MFHCKRWNLVSAAFIFLLFSFTARSRAATADFSRFVVVGDSLAAGVENIGLLDLQQRAGFAALIARQTNNEMVLPLAPAPGVPNILEIKHTGLVPVIGPIDGTLPMPPRENYTQQPTNLAVPGFTVADALNFRPDPNAPPGPLQWGNLVLGFPSPFITGGESRTMIEQAVMLNPTTTLVWIGNNDALIGVMIGDLSVITPLPAFAASYKAVLDQLSATKSTLITATIPDVTSIPFFTSAQEVANLFHVDPKVFGIASGDYVRRSALPIIQQMIDDGRLRKLPLMCPSPIYALPVDQVPCKLTARDATTIQVTVKAYNAVILLQSWLHGAKVMDTYALGLKLHAEGYDLNGRKLTTAFLGGLFSLDGIHPTNTGYAVIANFMIDQLNAAFRLQIPKVSVQDVFNADPLAQYVTQ